MWTRPLKVKILFLYLFKLLALEIRLAFIFIFEGRLLIRQPIIHIYLHVCICINTNRPASSNIRNYLFITQILLKYI